MLEYILFFTRKYENLISGFLAYIYTFLQIPNSVWDLMVEQFPSQIFGVFIMLVITLFLSKLLLHSINLMFSKYEEIKDDSRKDAREDFLILLRDKDETIKNLRKRISDQNKKIEQLNKYK